MLVVLGAMFTGAACVGDSPSGSAGPGASSADAGGASSSSSRSEPDEPDAASSGGSSGGSSSGDVDSSVPQTGGNTLAQLAFQGRVDTSQVLATGDGGVLMAFNHAAPTNLIIGQTTVACTHCAVVVKLDATLENVVWFAHSSDDLSSDGLTASPDGRVYWALGGRSPGTASIRDGAAATRTFTIVSGEGEQGEGTGGSRLVVALNGDGSIRWVNELRQTDTTGVGNDLGDISAFGASNKTVVATLSYAQGTLAWTPKGVGSGTKTLATRRYTTMQLDADTGVGFIGEGPLVTAAHAEFKNLVGIEGYDGSGFAFTRVQYAANGVGGFPAGVWVSLGKASGGALSSVVDYAAVVPATMPNTVRAARYKDSAMALGYVPGSLSFGDVAVQSGGSTDSAFFILDKIATKVRAHSSFGGTGYDVPVAMVQVPGVDEVYCVGTYRSTDMSLAGSVLPAPADAVTDGMYVMRARVDTTTKTLTPLWARGYVGDPGGRISVESASADPDTGDLFVSGWLGGPGAFNFGGDAITTTELKTKLFALRIERGN